MPGLKLTLDSRSVYFPIPSVNFSRILLLTLFSSFKPDTGDKAGKFKAEYKHEKFLFNTDLGLAARYFNTIMFAPDFWNRFLS